MPRKHQLPDSPVVLTPKRTRAQAASSSSKKRNTPVSGHNLTPGAKREVEDVVNGEAEMLNLTNDQRAYYDELIINKALGAGVGGAAAAPTSKPVARRLTYSSPIIDLDPPPPPPPPPKVLGAKDPVQTGYKVPHDLAIQSLRHLLGVVTIQNKPITTSVTITREVQNAAGQPQTGTVCIYGVVYGPQFAPMPQDVAKGVADAISYIAHSRGGTAGLIPLSILTRALGLHMVLVFRTKPPHAPDTLEVYRPDEAIKAYQDSRLASLKMKRAVAAHATAIDNEPDVSTWGTKLLSMAGMDVEEHDELTKGATQECLRDWFEGGTPSAPLPI
ncbi:hypothetical protein MAPG_05431 [Magnaporthiopsis poae ATCC 64411]|uniref:Uncharacterized protein n=1 Tax=Magnaporthiopsis poae (strain ATCC 64411 / 73-15) TaxID=644358 RepID=A0A0C4DZD6_MAGP6|nr:hypothetical protein MAPG_05431 [Magnaporthiopsis poae ATCC 64411]